MEDFAVAVGLSRPTISKYFHDPNSVRPGTRAKIEVAIKRFGFRPNLFAVNLNRRRSKIVGLIVPDPVDPFYTALARRIETLATDAGYLAFILSSEGKPELEREAIEQLTALNVAGAIIAPLGQRSHLSRLKELGAAIPLVFVDSPLDGSGPFVGTDNRQSISLMTEYLCRLGDRPAYFDMPAVNYNALERRQAYADTMQNLGIQPCFVQTSPSESWDFERFAFEETKRVLKSSGPPSKTILCANDRIAFGVLAAVYDAGLKVGIGPNCDLKVAGHDNQPLSAFTCPTLTTVSQNYAEIGRLALGFLVSMIESEDNSKSAARKKERILVRAELVLRKSA